MSKRIPGATYRLQFNRDFTFAQASDVACYLHELGITDCYASPLFKACAQSTHGYDVCDFGQLNPNLGAAADFEQLAAHLRDLNMGLMLDLVPNHMSTATANSWWSDVLENGPNSTYANWFDIDWNRFSDGKVVLPILEADFETVLSAGKLRLVFEENFLVAYHDRRLPLSPESRAKISKQTAECGADIVLKELNGTAGQPASFARLNHLLEQQHYRLAFWKGGQINYRRFFDVNELVSLRMELPEVFDATHHLVSTLIREGKVTGLRIDHPDGLWDPQQYLRRLEEKFGTIYVVVEKILTRDEMLPEDWPADGTTGYDFLNCLNGIFVNPANKEAFDDIYHKFHECNREFHEMVYEAKKCLLRNSFASELDALTRRLERIANANQCDLPFTSNELREVLTEVLACFPVYRTYVTEQTAELNAVEKRQIENAINEARIHLSVGPQLWRAPEAGHPSLSASEVALDPLSVPEGRTKIAQRFNIGTAIGTPPSPGGSDEPDPLSEDAAHTYPPRQPESLRFIRDLLLQRASEDLGESAKRQRREFVMKFQQLTGPLMAKGLEDTTFYNFNRLISLNEVGGNPDSFGNSVDDFHNHNLQKAARWPHSLLATATHDTKRGEDVRARINVLSEMPNEWRGALNRWQKLNASKKSLVHGQPAPDSNDEHFYYQTLLGAWPAEISAADHSETFRNRMVACLLKSIKESKAYTSWDQPNSAYEDATRKFVEQTLEDSPANVFLNDFKTFQWKIAFFGRLNSLSQVLLKMTAPGVPDFYQGSELWDLNLVDPDNRRPVDYELRRRILDELKIQVGQESASHGQWLLDILRDDKIGRSKLYLIWRLLEFRNRHRALFDTGTYLPLAVVGKKKEHICAFARIQGDEMAVVVAPHFFAGLTNTDCRLPLGLEIWQDTMLHLPRECVGGEFFNVLTNEKVCVSQAREDHGLLIGQLLAQFPIAVLEYHAETR